MSVDTPVGSNGVSEARAALERTGVKMKWDPDVVAAYAADRAEASKPGTALGVALPTTAEEVSAVLRTCNELGIPVVPRGAGTGIAGAADASDGCLIVSTDKMAAIIGIDADNMLARVQPGVITADLDRAAAKVGLMYAPDPGSVESCTIGGNVATNAGGFRCVKYGVTRDAIAGLQVVLPDGRIIRTGRQTVKNVSGYDLTGLFTGSEGTLGIITQIDAWLRVRPEGVAPTLIASFPTVPQAVAASSAVSRAGLDPELMEMMDRTTVQAVSAYRDYGFAEDAEAVLLVQTTGWGAETRAREIGALCEQEGADEVMVSEDATEAAYFIGFRRDAFPALEQLGAVLVEDVSVPRTKMAQMCALITETAAKYDVTIATLAHAGDGNLHPCFIYDHDGDVPAPVLTAADEIFRAAIAVGGSLTGEHGVGVLKRAHLAEDLGVEALAVCHQIKDALDPNGIMNPGKAI